MRAETDADDPPEPEDWAAVWAAILGVRAALADGDDAARNAARGLSWTDAGGWHLAGHCSAGSSALFTLYKPLLDAATPPAARCWVAQLGQSLDGCIATAGGDSAFVTGPQSLLHLHRLRALSDAVLVGAGTVAADDPQLTTRRVPGRHPVRVLLDPAVRLDGRARVFRDGQAPTLWLCDARHRRRAEGLLAAGAGGGAPGAQVLAIDGLLDGAGGFVPTPAIAALTARGLDRVFVEGGGVTVSRFLAAGGLQRLHLVIAPVLIGAGRRGLQLPAQTTLRNCLRPPARVVALGEDRLWDLDLAP